MTKQAIALLTVVFATATAITAAQDHKHLDLSDEERQEMMQEKEIIKAQYEEAIKNNDFASYKALQESTRETMKEKHGKAKDRSHNTKEHKYEAMTDADREEKMREYFDRKVAHYNETGELHAEHRGKKSFHRSGKFFGTSEKGIVKAALNKTNPERLEKVLERIDVLTEKLNEVEDERVLDLLLGIREVIEEKLAS